jgi:hypothetical protein
MLKALSVVESKVVESCVDEKFELMKKVVLVDRANQERVMRERDSYRPTETEIMERKKWNLPKERVKFARKLLGSSVRDVSDLVLAGLVVDRSLVKDKVFAKDQTNTIVKVSYLCTMKSDILVNRVLKMLSTVDGKKKCMNVVVMNYRHTSCFAARSCYCEQLTSSDVRLVIEFVLTRCASTIAHNKDRDYFVDQVLKDVRYNGIVKQLEVDLKNTVTDSLSTVFPKELVSLVSEYAMW